MNKDEQNKLVANLNDRLKEIDIELSTIASEDPIVKGDFNVKVDDLGKSDEDNEQEAGELDRNQAIVTTLEKERKEIENTLGKLEKGEYGR